MLEVSSKSCTLAVIAATSACNVATAVAVEAVAREACTASTSACNVARLAEGPERSIPLAAAVAASAEAPAAVAAAWAAETPAERPLIVPESEDT